MASERSRRWWRETANTWKVAVALCAAVAVVWATGLPRQMARRRGEYEGFICGSNVRNITMALEMYLGDNDNVFPPADRWRPLLADYVKYGVVSPVWFCPASGERTGFYAFNSALSGVARVDLAELHGTIAVFETDSSRNLSGGPILLPAEPRHSGHDYYGFVYGHSKGVPEGHTKSIPRKKNADGTWAKEPEADWVIWEPVVKESEEERESP